MTDFMIHFLICNILISGIIGLLLLTKKILKNLFTARSQYNLWVLMFVLLVLPFLPFHFVNLPHSLIDIFSKLSNSQTANTTENIINTDSTNSFVFINDFAISVSSHTAEVTGYIFFEIWVMGIIAMLLLVAKSFWSLHKIKSSALPLQNKFIQDLYHNCLLEMHIHKHIPLYSTAFIKSPIITGLIKPAIYLPIHLISDYTEIEMRHMLLHELNHYRHRDAISNYCMNLARIVYWFNPVVWIAINEMRVEREIACDTSVLRFLGSDSNQAYGNTLINFAEKISITPFPFIASLGGNIKHMRRRIVNIKFYQTPTIKKRIKSHIAFILLAVILFSTAPLLSTYAADNNHYLWKTYGKNISTKDLSNYFETYDGSFVLYDISNDEWTVYNIDYATTRVAPDSTYKIYSALFGLDKHIITPENTTMEWDHTNYPFDAWEADQNLNTAMASSVNWYFQSMDSKIGAKQLSNYLSKLQYGNMAIQGNLESFWMESSLKISPVEQALLLTKLYQDDLTFSTDNMNAVKNSIHIASSSYGEFYGKTGTGRVNENDINGWFIGYVTSNEHIYIFVTNIQADSNANGSNASEITLSILSDMNIWK